MLSRRQLALSALALSAAGPVRAEGPSGPVEVPIRLNDQRVLIDVMLEGHGPYPFIIDTGAMVSGVRVGLARELKLQQRGSVPMNGGTLFPMFLLKDLVFGGVLRQQGVALLGLRDLRLGSDGLLAAGMLTTLDSDLDFAHGVWRLWPNGAPARTGYERAGTTEAVDSPGGVSRRIMATLNVGGAPVRSLMDTGAPRSLSLDNATGRRLGLWNDTTPYVPLRVAHITGPDKSLSRLVRGPEVKLGSVAWPAPLLVIDPPDGGGTDGLMGLSLIRTLDLAFNHTNRSLWVRSNGVVQQELPYNGSGLWLEAGPSGVTVAEVGTGSPAAKAGVRVGDVLDGVPDLRTATRLVNGGPPANLKLKRGGSLVEASFTPRPYL